MVNTVTGEKSGEMLGVSTYTESEWDGNKFVGRETNKFRTPSVE